MLRGERVKAALEQQLLLCHPEHQESRQHVPQTPCIPYLQYRIPCVLYCADNEITSYEVAQNCRSHIRLTLADPSNVSLGIDREHLPEVTASSLLVQSFLDTLITPYFHVLWVFWQVDNFTACLQTHRLSHSLCNPLQRHSCRVIPRPRRSYLTLVASLLQRVLLSVAGLCADIRPLLLFSLPPQLPCSLTALRSALLSVQTQVRDRLAAFKEAAAAAVLGGCGTMLAELDASNASVSEKSSKQVVHLYAYSSDGLHLLSCMLRWLLMSLPAKQPIPRLAFSGFPSALQQSVTLKCWQWTQQCHDEDQSVLPEPTTSGIFMWIYACSGFYFAAYSRRQRAASGAEGAWDAS